MQSIAALVVLLAGAPLIAAEPLEPKNDPKSEPKETQESILKELRSLATTPRMQGDVESLVAKLDAEHFIEGMRLMVAPRHTQYKIVAVNVLRAEIARNRLPKEKLGALALEFLPVPHQPAVENQLIGIAFECGTPGAADLLESRFVAAKTDRARFDALQAMMNYRTSGWRRGVVSFLNANTNVTLQGQLVSTIPATGVSVDQPDIVPMVKVLQILLLDDTKMPNVETRICEAAATALKNALHGFTWSLKPEQRRLISSTEVKDRDAYITLLDQWIDANVDTLETQWKSAVTRELAALDAMTATDQPTIDAVREQWVALVESDFGLSVVPASPGLLADVKGEVKKWWNNGALKPSAATETAKAIESQIKTRYTASTQPASTQPAKAK